MKIKKKCECGEWCGFDLDNYEEYEALKNTIKGYEEKLRSDHRLERKNCNYMLKKVKRGIKNNAVVYDCDSASGAFSFKLVNLMVEYIESNQNKYKGGTLRTIYIPPNIGTDLIFSDKKKLDVIKEDYLVYKGIEIVVDYGLDVINKQNREKIVSRNYYDYFKYLGGTMHTSKEYLLVGVCDNGEVILGSC